MIHLTKKQIKFMQLQLKQMLLYTGSVDGIIGVKTMKAIRQYTKANDQESRGVSVDWASLRKALGLDSLKDRESNTEIPVDVQADLIRVYGSVHSIQSHSLVRCRLPYPMKLAWKPSVTISSFSCHKDVKDDLEAIFNDILEYYGLEKIKELKLDLFGGCYNKRKIRGGSRWSTHAFGIAVDIAPQYNQLHYNKDKALFARPEYDKYWEIVAKHNFYSLGKEKNYDYMHIQRAIPIKR